MGSSLVSLAAIAAALGMTEAACKGESVATTTAPTATTTMSAETIEASVAPSALATAIASEAPTMTASVAPSAVASATPVPTTQPHVHSLACGAMPRHDHDLDEVLMKGPTVTVDVITSSTADGDQASVAALKARFRGCAMRALALDPSEQGTALLSVTIDATGTVTAASIAQSAGLATGTTACMVAAARAKQFSAGPQRTIHIQIRSTRKS